MTSIEDLIGGKLNEHNQTVEHLLVIDIKGNESSRFSQSVIQEVYSLNLDILSTPELEVKAYSKDMIYFYNGNQVFGIERNPSTPPNYYEHIHFAPEAEKWLDAKIEDLPWNMGGVAYNYLRRTLNALARQTFTPENSTQSKKLNTVRNICDYIEYAKRRNDDIYIRNFGVSSYDKLQEVLNIVGISIPNNESRKIISFRKE